MSEKHHTPEFEFIAIVALLNAVAAMSIDTMLPAIGTMASDLGALHSNDRQLIILGFFVGMMLGTPVFGPLSDSVGRKPTIFAGLAIYLVGAIMCVFSGSFYMLVLGRIVQGLGAAAPRIVSIAMVRDGAKGAGMARIMSFVMSVFMLVPIFAPSIGQAVLYIASWHYIFAGLAVAAVLAGTWVALRQDETLREGNRVPFSGQKLWACAKEVVSNPICFGYTLATGFVFSVFTTYLGTCQQIWAEQYGQGDKFALWFGGFGIVIALSMIANGKLVVKLGMRNLAQKAMYAYIAVWVVMMALCLMFAGQPPMALMVLLFVVWFFAAGFTFGNFNAMAMEPMGHIAGMAAAISGSISQGMAIILGGIAGRFYNGTLTPLAIAFSAFAIASFACMQWAESRRLKPAAVAA